MVGKRYDTWWSARNRAADAEPVAGLAMTVTRTLSAIEHSARPMVEPRTSSHDGCYITGVAVSSWPGDARDDVVATRRLT